MPANAAGVMPSRFITGTDGAQTERSATVSDLQPKLSDEEMISHVQELIDERDAMVRKAMHAERESDVMRGQCQAWKQALEIIARAAVQA